MTERQDLTRDDRIKSTLAMRIAQLELTNTELQVDLAEAHARIAELEARVAGLTKGEQ